MVESVARMEPRNTSSDSVYELLSDAELNVALHTAAVRMDLLNGWEGLHPKESEECAWLHLLPEVERAELERETIGVISNIRAELRRRRIKASSAR